MINWFDIHYIAIIAIHDKAVFLENFDQHQSLSTQMLQTDTRHQTQL